MNKNMVTNRSSLASLVIATSLLIFLNCEQGDGQTLPDNPYPYGNPVITHMYTADAAPRVMPDGRVWMVTSVDSELGGGYSTMHSYHTFSSADMVSWTDHGEILNLSDLDEPEGEDWALWAPDMIYVKGSYYLYFPIRAIMPDKKVKSWIAVAQSDSPDKRFKVISNRIEGTSGIDPAIFSDDDGRYYLYWGSRKVARMNEDMITLAENPGSLDIGVNNFMEASWMHKRKGIYYFNYHTRYDKPVSPDNPDDINRAKSQLDYCMGESPYGPMKYAGVLNYELGVNVKNGPVYPGRDYVPWRLTQSNHGGVVEFHGQDYLFYHNSALSSWRQDKFKEEGTWTQRSVCIDKIFYNDDGTMIPVRQTVEGVPEVIVKQPFEIDIQDEAVTVRAGKCIQFKNIDLGSGYYYFGLEASGVSQTGKIEVRADQPDGKLLGTVHIIGNGVMECSLREAHGQHDIYLVPESDFTLSRARLFAGSPLRR